MIQHIIEDTDVDIDFEEGSDKVEDDDVPSTSKKTERAKKPL